jgi:hypothetical protein
MRETRLFKLSGLILCVSLNKILYAFVNYNSLPSF